MATVSEPITATWESSGTGVTGLTPTIRIIDLADDSTVLTDTMNAVANCPGTYKYVFADFDVAKKYVARLDGGVGQEDRYRTIMLRSDAQEVSDYMDENSVKLSRLDANVSAVGSAGGWKGKPIVINFEKIVELLLKEKIGDKTLREIFEESSSKEEVKNVINSLKTLRSSISDLAEDFSVGHQAVLSEVIKPQVIEIDEQIFNFSQLQENISKNINIAEDKILSEIKSEGVNTRALVSEKNTKIADQIRESAARIEFKVPQDIKNDLNIREEREIKRKKYVGERKKFISKILKND